MAEFQEVMRQAERMCDSLVISSNYEHDCKRCPLNMDKTRNNCFVTRTEAPRDYQEAERAVMEWAAEHPEPVYPTWGNWLEEMGLIHWQNNGESEYSVIVPTFKMCTSIPADIAQKLGLKPKEG